MDGSEPCITAAGGEDMWLRADGELFKTAEDIVADSSVASSVWLLEWKETKRKPTVT